MSGALGVDPLALHKAGGHVLDATDESRYAHAQHHEALESALPGLPMTLPARRRGLIAAWTDQRGTPTSDRQSRTNMQDAAVRYHQADQDQSEHINAKATWLC